MSFFSRVSRIASVNTNQLLKRFENQIPVLERACVELKQQAVTVKKQAIELDKKLDGNKLPNETDLRKITAKLHEQAQNLKEKYEDCNSKIELLKAKKLAFETSLEIIKAGQGLEDGDATSIMRNVESYLDGLEAEIKAYTDLNLN